MSVTLLEDLTINLISNSQIYKDVPYDMVLIGIPLRLMFDQDQFQKNEFSLQTKMLSNILKNIYINIQPTTFSIDGSELIVTSSVALPLNSTIYTIGPQVDNVLLNVFSSAEESELQLTESKLDIESLALLRKYDRYLLIEYDPDNLFDMYFAE